MTKRALTTKHYMEIHQVLDNFIKNVSFGLSQETECMYDNHTPMRA